MKNSERTPFDAEDSGSGEVDRTTRRALLGLLGAASVLSACSTMTSPAPGSLPGGPDGGADAGLGAGPEGRVPEGLAREASFLALSLVDTPYRYGGNTPDSGFDCSGLIVYVYREVAGLALPRTVSQLARVGTPVALGAVRSGDLVLFDTRGRFSHAGIYVGDGRFVHAPSTGGTVRLDGVRARYWRPRFSGVRRV
jgi:cell wall-associated NlpC family hydrolase